MIRFLLLSAALLSLAACDANSSPQRQQAEAIAKRNPLDNADQDAVTLKMESRKGKAPKPPKVQKVDSREAVYFAGKKSKIYHCRGCEYAGKLDSPVGFASCDDAEKSGHVACEFCKPREHGVLDAPPPTDPR